MQKLPVENLHQIFRLACTDGGFTGCSLSQTSRAVRATSRIARFHSIALSIGFSRIESFIILYQKLRILEDGTRTKVTHLHLEDEEEGNMGFVADDSQASSYPQAIRLLHLVANDLVSLALQSMLLLSSPACDVHLTDRPFPSLTVLIANATSDNFVLATSAVPPLFPAVTHLHIVMSPRSLARASFSGWGTHAPRATHLRISFCPLVGTTLERLRILLGTPTWPRRALPARPPPAVRTCPSVRHVAIQPVAVRYLESVLRGTMGRFYWSLRSELSWMVEWANQEGVFESARILEPKPDGFTRFSSEWRIAVRESWERVVIAGVDIDWLTLGEEDEPSASI